MFNWNYIFFQNGALATIVGIRDARTAAYDTSTLVAAVVALVAYAHERARTHVRVAYNTFAIAFLAQATDCLNPVKIIVIKKILFIKSTIFVDYLKWVLV